MKATVKDVTRPTTPTHIALGDGLVLRSVQSQQDADRFVAFNADVVNTTQGLTCAKLLVHHPTMRWDDFFFVEDENTGVIVSCTCLIPWTCRFGEVDLRVAMLEMVLELRFMPPLAVSRPAVVREPVKLAVVEMVWPSMVEVPPAAPAVMLPAELTLSRVVPTLLAKWRMSPAKLVAVRPPK